MFLTLLSLPAPNAIQTGFCGGFALVGTGWMLVAVASGGFVSTYRAPAQNPWFYTVSSRASLVLPSYGPEAQRDLRDRMANQPIAMIRDVALAAPLFVVAGAFLVDLLLGVLALGAASALFVLFLALSRKR